MFHLWISDPKLLMKIPPFGMHFSEVWLEQPLNQYDPSRFPCIFAEGIWGIQLHHHSIKKWDRIPTDPVQLRSSC